MIDWLNHLKDMETNEVFYPLEEAKARFDVRELCRGGYLVINRTDEYWMKFAVLRFSYSDGDGKNVFLSNVFYGEGPPDVLRECRHTYWGDAGYLFYPPGEIITAAFKALSEFYDAMAPASERVAKGRGE